ncbi:adenosine deaminase [Corynebacterium sp. CCM 9204]|uniref:adenosine deaminase n=1 Tax=Corynebacterium sp. CCM 9204 TaxID=3057616 RepID=UPI003523A0EF
MYSIAQGSPEYSPRHKRLSRETIAALPKVVLHDHLDGGLRPGTVIDLAADCDYRGLPTGNPEELARWFVNSADSGSLPAYLETFAHTCAVMQTTAALHRVAREAVEDLAADGVVYAELRFAPEQHQEQGLGLQEIVDAVVDGCMEGEKTSHLSGHTIHARVILCAMRHADRAREIAELVASNTGSDSPGRGYVVGFDIAGAEAGFPPACCAGAFAVLREDLVPFTIHAGEAAGIDSLADAVSQGTWRIGHGARLFEDFSAGIDGIDPGRVSSYVRDRGIALELCPSSNVQTGVIDEITDHPLPLLHGLGFACTVNTDNRLVSGTSMTEEMMLLVETFDYGIPELFDLTVTAIASAFIPELQRREILEGLIVPGWEKTTIDDAASDEEESDRSMDSERSGSVSAFEGIDPGLLAELGIDPTDLD